MSGRGFARRFNVSWETNARSASDMNVQDPLRRPATGEERPASQKSALKPPCGRVAQPSRLCFRTARCEEVGLQARFIKVPRRRIGHVWQDGGPVRPMPGSKLPAGKRQQAAVVQGISTLTGWNATETLIPCYTAPACSKG